MKTLIIVPTYNERENISALLEAVLKLNQGHHILVVDDNSPDGTGEIVRQWVEKNPLVHLLSRAGRSWAVDCKA
jgi:dolichol-phosphate mannosyltransferase